MSKIYFDVDYMNKGIMPIVEEIIEAFSEASSIASNMSIPGDFRSGGEIRNISSHLKNCNNNLRIFNNWCGRLKTAYNKIISENSYKFSKINKIEIAKRENLIP